MPIIIASLCRRGHVGPLLVNKESLHNAALAVARLMGALHGPASPADAAVESGRSPELEPGESAEPVTHHGLVEHLPRVQVAVHVDFRQKLARRAARVVPPWRVLSWR
ncbi:unnamed protein product [Linum trigynum]|uniref:Uncharacterized protein n=1 Tax=Linum trigynum TaxID=586398 RepID=A0AAV2CCB0_9ROSI